MDIKNLTNLTNEILRRLSEWMIKMTKTFSDGSTAVKTVVTDASGNQITSFGSPSTIADYKSPSDFTATYATTSTILLSGYNFQLDTGVQIVYIRQRNMVTNISNVYVNGASGYSFKFDTATSTITLYKDGGLADLLSSNDSYEVGINSSTKAYDIISNSNNTFISNYPVQPLHNVLIAPSTSVVENSWFPTKDGVDVGVHKTHTFTGILAPATSQVLTITLEGTNADDLTVDANWTALDFFNVASLTVVKTLATSAGTSTPFNLRVTDCGYRNIRFRLTPSVNTNANTCNAYLNSIY